MTTTSTPEKSLPETSTPAERAAARYLLPNGEPRYGIRIEPASDEAQAPVAPAADEPSTPSTSKALRDILDQAQGLTKVQLQMAAMFSRVKSFGGDDDSLIAGLRVKHPGVHAEAVQMVQGKIGTPGKWREKVRYKDPTMDKVLTAENRSLAARIIRIILVSITCNALAVGYALFLLEEGVPAKLAVVSLFITLITVRVVVNWMTKQLPFIPAKFTTADAKRLHPDVVNAAFIALLQHKGHDLDERTVRAGMRGWERLRFNADKVNEMWAIAKR